MGGHGWHGGVALGRCLDVRQVAVFHHADFGLAVLRPPREEGEDLAVGRPTGHCVVRAVGELDGVPRPGVGQPEGGERRGPETTVGESK